MLVVIATLPGRPEKRDEIAAALTTAAAASRGEEGCLSYAFTRDLEDEDRYVSVETWRDQAALDAHFGTPHLVELLGKAEELLAGPPVIETYVVTT
ncbi:MAG: antibiotic biosynthesis monooxygenase [Actinobacteria bacterium]|nr:antibiotic biosynthesis monooxygenase [Actinomycetota bacterium]